MASKTSSFYNIPILDLSLANSPDTKEIFLQDLRHALLEVGFLYIKHFGVDEQLIRRVISEGRGFFEIPDDKKLEIEMKNAPSFLGMFLITPFFWFCSRSGLEGLSRIYPPKKKPPELTVKGQL